MRYGVSLVLGVVFCLPLVASATVTNFSLVSGASGHVAGSNGTYATLHDQATGNVAGNGFPNIQNEVFGGSYLMMRAPLVFDTSSLSGQVVDSAYLLTRCSGTTRSSAGSSATIVQYTGSDTTIDANQFSYTFYGTASGGDQLLSAWSNCAIDVDLNLNATGITWISTTGLTKIALRDSGDIGSTVPGGIQSRLAFEDGGNPIELVVTHHTSSGGGGIPSGPFVVSTTTASTTAELIGTVQLASGIIIVILMVYLIAYLYNSIFRKKQWQR